MLFRLLASTSLPQENIMYCLILEVRGPRYLLKPLIGGGDDLDMASYWQKKYRRSNFYCPSRPKGRVQIFAECSQTIMNRAILVD